MLQPTAIYILSLSPVAMWSTQTHTTHGRYLCLNSCQLWSAHLHTVKWIKLRFPLPPDLSTLICMLITSLASVSLFYPFLDFLSTVILIEFLALSSVYGEETEARWCRGAGDSGDCLFLPPLSFHWSKPRWASCLGCFGCYQGWILSYPSSLPRTLVFNIWLRCVLLHLCFAHPWTPMAPPVL